MQVVFAGKTWTSLEITLAVAVPFPPVILFLIFCNILSFTFLIFCTILYFLLVPPVIMRPARGGLYIYTRQVQIFAQFQQDRLNLERGTKFF